MKLLVSDYDGTIKTFIDNPGIIEKMTFQKNINAINNFRAKGNLFNISTGRTTNSIMKEIKKYNINYDYVTTLDGSVIHDNNGKLVDAIYFQKEYLKKIKDYIELSNYIKRINMYNELGHTKEMNNIVSIIITAKKYNLTNLVKELKEIDSQKYFGIYPYSHESVILKQNITKADGIKNLIEKKQIIIDKEDIHTIGDGINDLEMIEEYNGNVILLCDPSLFFSKEKKITSVHKLIKKINI